MTILQTDNLTKYYGSFRGIEDVNLTIAEGEIFGFLGPNGAGKTTTIRILLDLIRPTSGRFEILGASGARQLLAVRGQIGNLPGEIGFYQGMTGQEFLDYLGRYQTPRGPVLQAELCRRFKLEATALAKKIKYYSKGMKQKLGLVQAMQHDPRLLILDEPSEALDPLMQQVFYEILLEFKERGTTIFFSSHVLSEVEKICDRIAIIRDGCIQAVEHIQNLKRQTVRRMTVFAAEHVLSQIEHIDGVTLEMTYPTSATYRFTGKMNALLTALAPLPIDDLIFPDPELEDIFLQFYQQDAGRST